MYDNHSFNKEMSNSKYSRGDDNMSYGNNTITFSIVYRKNTTENSYKVNITDEENDNLITAIQEAFNGGVGSFRANGKTVRVAHSDNLIRFRQQTRDIHALNEWDFSIPEKDAQNFITLMEKDQPVGYC